jgi:hypothetical protein
VARDEAGNPVLPITVKGTTILDLGEIVWDRPLFHSKQYLWPTGFKSTKYVRWWVAGGGMAVGV